jgi:hypothetical protein
MLGNEIGDGRCLGRTAIVFGSIPTAQLAIIVDMARQFGF